MYVLVCLPTLQTPREKQQNSVSTKTSPRVVQSTNPSTILTQSHFFFSCCHLFPSDRLHAARLFETDMKQTQRRTLSFHACLLHASVRACARVCVRTPVSRSTCLRVSANGAAGLKRAEARVLRAAEAAGSVEASGTLRRRVSIRGVTAVSDSMNDVRPATDKLCARSRGTSLQHARVCVFTRFQRVFAFP